MSETLRLKVSGMVIKCCRKCANKESEKETDVNKKLQYFSVMFLCPLCGNKRCPKATDCSLDCTKSNEPNQTGSAY